MTITEIQIIPIKPKDGLVAIGSVLLNNCLYLGSIGIHKKIDGSGYRITYPTKKIGNRDINIYHPINAKTSKVIEEAVVKRATEIIGL